MSRPQLSADTQGHLAGFEGGQIPTPKAGLIENETRTLARLVRRTVPSSCHDIMLDRCSSDPFAIRVVIPDIPPHVCRGSQPTVTTATVTWGSTARAYSVLEHYVPMISGFRD